MLDDGYDEYYNLCSIVSVKNNTLIIADSSDSTQIYFDLKQYKVGDVVKVYKDQEMTEEYKSDDINAFMYYGSSKIVIIKINKAIKGTTPNSSLIGVSQVEDLYTIKEVNGKLNMKLPSGLEISIDGTEVKTGREGIDADVTISNVYAYYDIESVSKLGKTNYYLTSQLAKHQNNVDDFGNFKQQDVFFYGITNFETLVAEHSIMKGSDITRIANANWVESDDDSDGIRDELGHLISQSTFNNIKDFYQILGAKIVSNAYYYIKPLEEKKSVYVTQERESNLGGILTYDEVIYHYENKPNDVYTGKVNVINNFSYSVVVSDTNSNNILDLSMDLAPNLGTFIGGRYPSKYFISVNSIGKFEYNDKTYYADIRGTNNNIQSNYRYDVYTDSKFTKKADFNVIGQSSNGTIVIDYLSFSVGSFDGELYSANGKDKYILEEPSALQSNSYTSLNMILFMEMINS